MSQLNDHLSLRESHWNNSLEKDTQLNQLIQQNQQLLLKLAEKDEELRNVSLEKDS